MKIAFVFPGQGSQSVGMLDSFRDNAAVQSVVARASSALEQNIGALIEAGPAEELNLTINTQPALLTAGYAIYAAWRAAGGAEPPWLRGIASASTPRWWRRAHSNWKTRCAWFAFARKAMQEAVPVGIGSMAAILGLPDDKVRQACGEAAQGEVVEPVNFNAPSQVVIAGHSRAVERACEVAKRLGAKRAVPLSVSAPFHSSLLQPASDRLRERLAQTTLKNSRIDLINNVDVSIESEPSKMADALARQAASPVRWSDTIRKMSELGVTHVIECGPGRVLSGLTKRIVPGLESLVVNDAATLASTLAALQR